MAPTVVPMTSSTATHVLEWSDADLTTLLTLRPDLRAPVPGTVTALAARAGTVRSSRLAVLGLNAPSLAVLEAVCALGSLVGSPGAEDLARATGLEDVAFVDELLADLAARALVVAESPSASAAVVTWAVAPGVTDALGQFPAGLALTGSATHADPRAARTGLGGAARRILDALLWGPPVGTLPLSPAPDAGAEASALPAGLTELLDAGLLRRSAAEQVVLPGALALALRGGRTHRDIAPTPPLPDAPTIAADVVEAEAARAALDAVRHVTEVANLWGKDPAGALRSGAVGVREIRRASSALGTPEAETTFTVELAALGGDIAPLQDADGGLWAPTDAYLDEDASAHWARLALAWWSSPRVFALIGTRSDDGALRSSLEPGLERGWAVRLRRRVLDAVAAWPALHAPRAADIAARLAWDTPASPPPDWAVEAVLREAHLLGVLGAGALTSPGLALLDPEATVHTLTSALTRQLPPAETQMVVQADLTAMVPGRPSAELDELLSRTATVESRGAALTVRFSPESLARALASGWSAAYIVEQLRAHSRTELPQALEYAVTDAERRHGGLRSGAAASYLRCEDPVLLSSLVHDPDLAMLGLRLLAPTVAISDLSAVRLTRVLADTGRTTIVEGPGGDVLDIGPGRVVAPIPRRRPGSSEAVTTEVDASAAVAHMREGQARAKDVPAADPASVMTLLKAAIGRSVWLTIAGPSGEVQRRRVRPLRLDGPRVVVRDEVRESDLTVGAHRIVAVEEISA